MQPGVQIRTDGCRYLGAAIGSPEFVSDYSAKKVDAWLGEVDRLCKFAASQPQAAYSAYVHGLRSKWTFLCRTMPELSSALDPLDQLISHRFVQILTGRPIGEEELAILSLPCRFGGIGLSLPSYCSSQYASSKAITI